MATPKLKLQPSVIDIPQGFEILPTAILVFHPESKTFWANTFFAQQFGTPTLKMFTPVLKPSLSDQRPISIETLTQEGRHEGYGLKTAQGNVTPVEIKISKVKLNPNDSSPSYVVVMDNVEIKIELQRQLVEEHLRLKEIQNALIQSSKMASLGEVSAGIAHELNQPLQAILGFSQELERSNVIQGTEKEYLNDIVKGAIKMREIIKSLRTFAHDAGTELVPTSVEHAIQEAVKIVNHHLLQNGIEVECVFASNIPMVRANPIQLEQVLINLFSNAKDAILKTGNQHGRITVTLQTEPKKTRDPQVLLSVQDNGCGMPPEIQAKIFDPFFTTKEVGKGTGLGLSITHGILKSFDASIAVDSKPNSGTQFTIKLNAVQKNAVNKQGEKK